MQKQSRKRLGAAVGSDSPDLFATSPAAAQGFTDWGWPQPYEKVSAKSVDWLKQKGWWPLGFGWQGPFSGQNTINVVMDKAGLLEKRGIEINSRSSPLVPTSTKRSRPRASRSAMAETFPSRRCSTVACRFAPLPSLRRI